MGENMNPIVILLVEDNPGDVRLIKETLQEDKFFHRMYVTKDGEEAMDFLRRKGKYSEAPCPDLILLDLNLPKKDGREVLAEMKSDPELKRIPIVVLTTSEAEQDILMTYDLYANCYITKPVNLDQFIKVVRSIEAFWFTIVKLPSKEVESRENEEKKVTRQS